MATGDADLSSEFIEIFLEEAQDLLVEWERICMRMQDGATQADCDALFRSAHNLKGSARSVGLASFAGLIHRAEDVISLVRADLMRCTPQIVKALLDTQSALEEWRVRLQVDTAAPPPALAQGLEQSLLELKTTGASTAAAVAAETSAFGFFDDPVPAPVTDAAPPRPAEQPGARKRGAGEGHESIRVPSAKIDSLMLLVGELATQQATISHYVKLGQASERICQNAVQIASKLTRELQVQTMGLRLVDLSKLFQRLERTARDLAGAQDKLVSIVLEGSEVELDKSVVERMVDPMVHLVRNAVDHGIEAPEGRGAKPREATLTLRATQLAGEVVIEIIDDGRGMDPEKIFAKARANGLLRDNETLPPERAYDFIFAPGFSTAAVITDVSGRGVGLDVVKQTITTLGGGVSVTSTLGSGTRFAVTLPLNVSIVDSLIVAVEGEHYAVPILEVSEVIDLGAFRTQARTGAASTISLRDRAVTVRRMSAHLPVRKKAAQAASEQGPALVVDCDGGFVAFAFDRIVAQQAVVIRNLSPYLENLPGFSGSAILASGEPAIVVSPRALARHVNRRKEAV
jgi:two-component system chemotaxis sensor kinase CheA